MLDLLFGSFLCCGILCGNNLLNNYMSDIFVTRQVETNLLVRDFLAALKTDLWNCVLAFWSGWCPFDTFLVSMFFSVFRLIKYTHKTVVGYTVLLTSLLLHISWPAQNSPSARLLQDKQIVPDSKTNWRKLVTKYE